MPEQREHFRVVYPAGASARFSFKAANYMIVDISQSGVKFSLPKPMDAENYVVGQNLKGTIHFLFGVQLHVNATVLRISPTHIVLVLAEPIPLKTMYDEHRYIIQKFEANAKKT